MDPNGTAVLLPDDDAFFERARGFEGDGVCGCGGDFGHSLICEDEEDARLVGSMARARGMKRR